ncbi:MAG TPA: hypothetical protein PKY30_05190 [Myxococcota bacterium]|nr:hypothetical protein [Myxococcota bacterium]HNH46407.1 hypothetical protein [Myxococcota bacterium]
MSQPYIPRVEGDLITAADWNEIQLRTRADIAAVDAKITGIDPSSSITVRDLTVTGAARLGLSGGGVYTAYMKATETTDQGYVWRWPKVRNYFYGGSWSGANQNTYGAKYSSEAILWGPTGDFYQWGLIPSPKLSFSLPIRCAVSLHASAQLLPSSSTTDLWTQFVLSQGGKYAPVRINPNNCNYRYWTYANSGNGTYTEGFTPPCEPSAENWPKWLAHFDAICDTWNTGKGPRGWPIAGVLTTSNSDNRLSPWSMEEWCELPAGDYSVQVGFTTNETGSSYVWRLRDMVLRAMVVPLGERP